MIRAKQRLQQIRDFKILIPEPDEVKRYLRREVKWDQRTSFAASLVEACEGAARILRFGEIKDVTLTLRVTPDYDGGGRYLSLLYHLNDYDAPGADRVSSLANQAGVCAARYFESLAQWMNVTTEFTPPPENAAIAP